MSTESAKDLKSLPTDTKAPAESAEPSSNHENSRTAVSLKTTYPENAPTDSHALATQEHEQKGAAQQNHEEPEVKDLGWNKDPEHIPAPLVVGLPNEELWVLVRRFNHVQPES